MDKQFSSRGWEEPQRWKSALRSLGQTFYRLLWAPEVTLNRFFPLPAIFNHCNLLGEVGTLVRSSLFKRHQSPFPRQLQVHSTLLQWGSNLEPCSWLASTPLLTSYLKNVFLLHFQKILCWLVVCVTHSQKCHSFNIWLAVSLTNSCFWLFPLCLHQSCGLVFSDLQAFSLLFSNYNTVCCWYVSRGFLQDFSLSVDMCVWSFTCGAWTSVPHKLHTEFRASWSHGSRRSFWQIDTLLFLPESPKVPSLPTYLWINFNLLSITFL